MTIVGHDSHPRDTGGAAIATPAWKRPFEPKRKGEAIVKSLSSKSWSNITATMTEVVFDGSYAADLDLDCARLSVTLDLVGEPLDLRIDRGRRGPEPANSIHNMNFAPARTAMWAMSSHTRYLRHVTFTFGDQAIEDMLDEEISPSAFQPRLLFVDAALLHIARLFEAECDAKDSSPLLYGDSLSVALLLRLASIGKTTRSAPSKGGLPPHRLRLVTDYLHAHLAENVSLRELANVAQVSRSHFARGFKSSTGVSPHRWLLNARIERSKELLLSKGPSLAEVAFLTGFADQAHFSRQFRHVLGLSPSSWRRRAGH